MKDQEGQALKIKINALLTETKSVIGKKQVDIQQIKKCNSLIKDINKQIQALMSELEESIDVQALRKSEDFKEGEIRKKRSHETTRLLRGIEGLLTTQKRIVKIRERIYDHIAELGIEIL